MVFKINPRSRRDQIASIKEYPGQLKCDISDSPLTFQKKARLRPAKWEIVVLLLSFVNFGINCSLVSSFWILEFILTRNRDDMSSFF